MTIFNDHPEYPISYLRFQQLFSDFFFIELIFDKDAYEVAEYVEFEIIYRIIPTQLTCSMVETYENPKYHVLTIDINFERIDLDLEKARDELLTIFKALENKFPINFQRIVKKMMLGIYVSTPAEEKYKKEYTIRTLFEEIPEMRPKLEEYLLTFLTDEEKLYYESLENF